MILGILCLGSNMKQEDNSMKNFRKVLALILVVATLFSFVAMASAKSATEYSDYADVKYVEAVDVLTAIGVINGYDGAFHPADNIDRDEMAKMVAVLRNAGDFNADLYASANKFADVEGSWAEGYIAYCAQLGIIAGRNVSTFDPDGKVTGVEVAKMLLCVLGFDAQEQGYVGAGWETHVLRDANKMGLLAGLADVDPYAAATRDQAAQMFLNALEAPMVAGYLSQNVVKITNSLYGELDTNDEVKLTGISTYEALQAGGWEVAAHNAVISKTPLYEIFASIVLHKEDAVDCYLRPSTRWTVVVGLTTVLDKVYPNAAAAYYTDTAALAADFTTLLKAGYSVAVRTNGNNTPVTYTAEQILTGAASVGGKGVESWVYIDAATGNGWINVYVKEVYIGVVTAVNPFNGTFTLQDGNVFAQTANEVAVDDVVLYYLCNGGLNHAAPNTATSAEKLHEIVVVEPTVGTVTAGQQSAVYGDWFVADGKTINYNKNFGLRLVAGGQDKLEHADAGKYYIYTDKFGNAMYVAPYSLESEDYAYVVEGTAKHVYNGYSVGAIAGVTPDCDDTADLVKFTGVNDSTLTPANAEVNHDIVDLMARTAGEAYGTTNPSILRGIGRLVKTGTTAAGLPAPVVAAEFAPAGTQLTKGSNVISNPDRLAADLYMDTATKIMVRTQAADGTYSYKEYVGYQNLPATYISETVTVAGSNELNGEITNIQYFSTTIAGGVEYATYVFIDAKYTPAAATRFFNMGETDVAYAFNVAYDGFYANDYYVYRALVDGVDSFVAIDKNANAQPLEKNKIYTGMVEYIGSAIDFNGVTLPLYRSATKVEAVDGDAWGSIVGVYVDKNGAVQLQIRAAHEPVTANTMYPVTEGFKIYTIVANDGVNPNTFAGYYVENPAALSGLTISNSYVIWNATKTAVEAVYRIAA